MLLGAVEGGLVSLGAALGFAGLLGSFVGLHFLLVVLDERIVAGLVETGVLLGGFDGNVLDDGALLIGIRNLWVSCNQPHIACQLAFFVDSCIRTYIGTE